MSKESYLKHYEDILDVVQELVRALSLDKPVFTEQQMENKEYEPYIFARIAEDYAHRAETFTRVCDFIDLKLRKALVEKD